MIEDARVERLHEVVELFRRDAMPMAAYELMHGHPSEEVALHYDIVMGQLAFQIGIAFAALDPDAAADIRAHFATQGYEGADTETAQRMARALGIKRPAGWSENKMSDTMNLLASYILTGSL